MALKIQLSRKAFWVRFLMHPLGKVAVGISLALAIAGMATFTYYYVKYSRLIDQKLRSGPFPSTSMVFAAPRVVTVGDEITAEEIISQLRRSGYGESNTNRMGWYHLRLDGALEIFPGPDSYFDNEPGVIKFSDNRVSRIISLRDNTDRMQYLLEPELITNLTDSSREKRRLVRFADIPQVLVHAVLSAEDKRFFQHAGFDPLRVIKVAYQDLKETRKAAGASTLSMQLARMFWLNPSKTWRRKAAEVLITLHLEQRLSKEEIFEYYANQVPLGRRGSFSIHGFGEAARAYFGKDIRHLTLPEAATLAGLIQQPSFRNPYRHPQRARDRRNVVLYLMRENGFITDEQYKEAIAAPLVLAPAEMESTEAPYFVDLVNDQLQSEFADHDFQKSTYRVYTTIDLNLQRAASEAVRLGMEEVDKMLSRRRWRKGETPPQAQCALVAIDPETGAIKALIGGRNYGVSQLNRALAKRQPGSAFKPFVFAAALNTAIEGGPAIFTPASTILDEPTTFWFDDKPYSPSNYKNEFHGVVTLRQALSKSLNIPTVKLAEQVGYETVENLAKRAGMNLNIRPTPAIALGAYEVTPIEVAAAYTIWPTGGVYVKPNWISLIRNQQGEVVYTHKPERTQVLDPRVAYIMTNLMQEVLRTGTGASVRARGFTLPAAGKTGTSHDGWFVGFTSKLICAVWVGFDDNRELGLEGARSALPIWTEFMKRAHQYREYRNVTDFVAPDGVVTVEIDPATGQLATAACPTTRPEVFISGTEPVEICRLHGGTGGTRVASWELPPPPPQPPAAPPRVEPPQRTTARAAAAQTPPAEQAKATPPEEPQKKKKGFFGRLLDVFK
ncbi:MAG TPA: PBP1A family penicillin-binding protein [Bryobacteraceae bacterium]|nr:PBP1A family penicillin-binding protein [Bryobacteraceae bacterium]